MLQLRCRSVPCMHACPVSGHLPPVVLNPGQQRPPHPTPPLHPTCAVAIALHLVGARPVKEGTGRIARFELVPLEELGGRPRVDVLCK